MLNLSFVGYGWSTRLESIPDRKVLLIGLSENPISLVLPVELFQIVILMQFNCVFTGKGIGLMKPILKDDHQIVNRLRTSFCRSLPTLALAAFALMAAAAADRKSGTDAIRILQVQGTVEIMPVGAKRWLTAQTNEVLYAADKLRTGTNSRATLRWSAQSILPVDALTEIEILPPDTADSLPGLMVKGTVAFLHRDKPGRIKILTRGSTAGVKGTEFVLTTTDVRNDERVMLAVIDGEVELSNSHGMLELTNHQQGLIEPGQPPVRTPGFTANNLLQWAFYYPGILDLNDLSLTPPETEELNASLEAYRAGDLLRALANYPESRQLVSDSERIYHAALLLSVGRVEQAEAQMAALPANVKNGRLAGALHTLIAAVKRSPRPVAISPQLATELLAASYYEQSRATGEESLQTALKLARRATAVSPHFGFAWERVAELEFGFGNIKEASRALERSLELSPRNAQALALKGFLLAANNKIAAATQWFDQAIAIDGALGNAWLGRGLCRIRQGDDPGGREDLLVAAALEPQRALLRSYLAKAYSNVGDAKRAVHEFELAKNLDPADPTAWLYTALLNGQNNRFNEGIRDLEKSQELNNNRRLFRSRLLLDEDHAVRSSTLAELYQEAGMLEVSAREAARAVTYDYANYSAHLFLAESYDALRDPTRFNLRYETPWFNELLLANLLSPVGGTPLSQNVSQQEYSRLFEHDRVGLSSSTEYRTDGQVRELASQYGNIGNTAWAFDLDYQHNDGVRPNNELDRVEWYTTIKQQLTPQDSVMLLIKYQDYQSGDNFQYYDPNATTTNLAFYGVSNSSVLRTNYTFDEYQHPIVVAGFHHEWSPGVHTLLLSGRLENDQRFSDTETLQLILTTNATGVTAANSTPMDFSLQSQFEIYTAELNQIFQTERQHLVFGGRFQTGKFQSIDQLSLSPIVGSSPVSFLTNYFNNPAAAGDISEPFERLSAYGYYTLEVVDDFRLTGGLTYDWLKLPVNFRLPPVAPGTDKRDQISPKAALVWNPIPEFTLRGIYSKALGGASFDDSFRLEPTQLAGFGQAFRTVYPDSVGSVSAPSYEIAGLALDVKLNTRTYLGVQAEMLSSEVDRAIGVFNWDGNAPPPPSIRPAVTPQTLDYEEHSISVTVNQLVSDAWSFGARYRFTQSELHTTLPAVPVSVLASADTTQQAELHQATIFALFNHPSGFFARAEANWYHQDNVGYLPALQSSDFWQGNLFLGWRSRRQRAEISVGVLNIGGNDYRLNPLNPYSELPRERVFVARAGFRF